MSKTPWLVYLRPQPAAELRLFCFPYAGGGAPIFREWPAGLSPSIKVCAVQFPGRGGRLKEAPFTRMAPLVEALTPALASQLDRPFAFFGHSLGALVAFEIARALRRRNLPEPRHLFVSAARAPHLPAPGPALHTLPEPEFREALRRLDGTPAEILANDEMMRLLLPALRADFEIAETYRCAPSWRASARAGDAESTFRDDTPAAPNAPLDCPITVFGGQQDARLSREALEAWQAHTRGGFSVHWLPGGHFFLHESREALLTAISRRLTSAAVRESLLGGATGD